MTRYIAFLRAINVGGHTVKMDTLRALFEALDFANVTTFQAAGNVIFETEETNAAKVEERIERHLKDSLGYAVGTYLRTPEELAAVVAYSPFPDVDRTAKDASLYVTFLKEAPTEETQKALKALATENDLFTAHGREVYWFCHTKISESPLFSGTLLGKTIGPPGTMRNITTVTKLATKYKP